MILSTLLRFMYSVGPAAPILTRNTTTPRASVWLFPPKTLPLLLSRTEKLQSTVQMRRVANLPITGTTTPARRSLTKKAHAVSGDGMSRNGIVGERSEPLRCNEW
jgi:hypothetical protein